MRNLQAASSSLKLEFGLQKEPRQQRDVKRHSCFFFEYGGLLKFDTVPTHEGASADGLKDQQETFSQDGDKDEEGDSGVQTYVISGGKTLVLQFNGSHWGNSSPDLVVVTTAKIPFKDNIAPYLWIVVKCSIQGNPFSNMGLSSVELCLPKPFTILQRSNGICFWEELFNMTVTDRTRLPTTMLGWPVCNPAFVDDQHGSIAAADLQCIDPELLPIRVIDIQATVSSHGGICFNKPTSWSFHTISHTWSLGVRSFSIAVSKLVTNSHELYNRIFNDANFSEDNPVFLDDPKIRQEAPKCYRDLIAFFILLQGEGVKAVWFDALCINQLQDDEKEREIAGMGEYYACSRGCYVLPHGVGMGYTLWALNGDKVELPPAAGQCTRDDHISQPKEFHPALPRWFNRVWTLQEFVLPQKLTFIAGGLSRVTIGRVNRFIRQGGGPAGLCMCTIPLRDPQFRYWDRGGNLRNAVEEEEILGSEQVNACKMCGHVPFIRKSREGVYFVDREAYCFVCQVDLGPSKHWVQHSMQMHPEFVLWNLTAVAFARHGNRSLTQATTLAMLRKWECTREEDRVLGVLGLLRGAKLGRFQVRTGQSLRSQICQLNRILGSGSFLKLWMMDEAGSPEMGMSWVPSCLSNHKQLLGMSSFNFSVKGDLNMRILHAALVVKGLEKQGAFLAASILSGFLIPIGQVMPCARLNPRCHRLRNEHNVELQKIEGIFVEPEVNLGGIPFEGVRFCVDCLYHSRNCKHLIRHCTLVLMWTSKGSSLSFPLAAHEGGCSHRSAVRIHSNPAASEARLGVVRGVDFRMVLAGVASVSALKPFPVRLVHLLTTAEDVFGLVCITRLENNSREVYHKIGTFSCPVQLDPFHQSNRSCFIGGFGGDVSEYVCS